MPNNHKKTSSILDKLLFWRKNKQTNQSQRQLELDKKLVYSLSQSKIPNIKQLKYLGKYLSPLESRLIKSCLTIIFATSLFWGINFVRTHLQVGPKLGGEYIEALIGSPKYINPLYSSTSDADSDISELIFSSLFKRDKNGELINDLAETHRTSDDGKQYTVKIREDAQWHNGLKLTATDIQFTFEAIKNPIYKSPLKLSYTGVNLEKIDDYTIKFTLEEPYAAFMELLTFEILPENLWSQIPPETATLTELNLKAIGSGPYRFKSLIRDKSGHVREYKLEANKDYYQNTPYVENLSFKFFVNFEEAVAAINENQVNGISYLPRELKNSLIAKDSLLFHNLNLPQITSLFINQQNNKYLQDKKVRQALAYTIDKNSIVSNVLDGDARTINSPILPDSFAYNKDIKKYKYNPEEASKLLDETGWKLTEITEDTINTAITNLESDDENIKDQARIINMLGQGLWRAKDTDTENIKQYLIIGLTTNETGDNPNIANAIKSNWEQIGVKTLIDVVNNSLIQSQIIKPRTFEVLLFGQIVGYDPDSYVFWHSSQTGEEGLNIANYKNTEIDALLEDARQASTTEVRIEKYSKFQDIIAEEVPAIFLYSPTYTYLQSNKIKGFEVSNILLPKDRFTNISDWYIKTGKKLIY